MVIRKLVDTAIKLSRYDSKAWDALYFGVRSDIKQGIRTGFGLGTVLGSFIDDMSSPYDTGSIQEKPPSNKFRQKYRRRYISSGSRRYKHKCPPRNRNKFVRRWRY